MLPSMLAKLAGLFFAATTTHGSPTTTQSPERYFIIRPGARSYDVSPVGHDTTQCPSRSRATSCRLSNVDFSNIVRDEDRDVIDSAFTYGYALVKARLGAPFVVTELWRPIADARPLGAYYRVSDSRVRCIKAPCPSLTAERLDGGSGASLSTLDLDALDVSDAVKRRARRLLDDGAVMVVGTIRDDSARGKGRTLVATQLFVPIVRRHLSGRPKLAPLPPSAS